VQSPSNTEEENIFTQSAEKYLSEREKAYKEELRAYRIFLWIAIFFCAVCLLLCLYGGSIFAEWNRNFNYYIAHETAISERREQREIKKDMRDSVAWTRHIKQMDRYDKLPDYKGE
jgi:hypothetical protein